MLDGIKRTEFNKISKKEKKKSGLFSQKSFIKGILDEDSSKYGKLPYEKEEFEVEEEDQD
jgi:hypothetical protein